MCAFLGVCVCVCVHCGKAYPRKLRSFIHCTDADPLLLCATLRIVVCCLYRIRPWNSVLSGSSTCVTRGSAYLQGTKHRCKVVTCVPQTVQDVCKAILPAGLSCASYSLWHCCCKEHELAKGGESSEEVV